MGNFEQVVLGFDSLESYLGKHPKFGATVGRFANRIKHGEFAWITRSFNLKRTVKEILFMAEAGDSILKYSKRIPFYVVKDTAIVVFSFIKALTLKEDFPAT